MVKKIKKTYKPINFNVSFRIEDLRKIESDRDITHKRYEGELIIRSPSGRYHNLGKFKILIGTSIKNIEVHNVDDLKSRIYYDVVKYLIKNYKF